MKNMRMSMVLVLGPLLIAATSGVAGESNENPHVSQGSREVQPPATEVTAEPAAVVSEASANHQVGSGGRENAAPSAACCQGIMRGDANGMGGDIPTIGDIVVMITAKFILGVCDGVIACLEEANVNFYFLPPAPPTQDRCADITISDISMLIDYLFISGPANYKYNESLDLGPHPFGGVLDPPLGVVNLPGCP